MDTNEIVMFEANSKTITCTVKGLADLNGYAAIITAKKKRSAENADLEVNGTINGLVITFELDPTDTKLEAGRYDYDITIDNGTKIYTITQSTLTIKESVKY